MLIFRPRRLRMAVVILGGLLCVTCAVGWVMLPPQLRAAFTAFQVVTLLIILAVVLFIMTALAMSEVRADEQTLLVRNGLVTHRIPWSRVHQVMLRHGDAWGLVLLKPVDGGPVLVTDVETRVLLGIQRSDGQYARRAVSELQSLLAASRHET